MLAAARKSAPADGVFAVPTVSAGTVEGTLSGRNAAPDPTAAAFFLHVPVTGDAGDNVGGDGYDTAAGTDDTLFFGATSNAHDEREPGADDLS